MTDRTATTGTLDQRDTARMTGEPAKQHAVSPRDRSALTFSIQLTNLRWIRFPTKGKNPSHDDCFPG